MSDMSGFLVSPLCRLITVIQLRMRDQLFAVTHKSLHMWLNFVTKNTRDTRSHGSDVLVDKPLFNIELLSRDGEVTLSPSIEELQNTLLSAVRRLSDSVSGFTCITPDLMSLLKFDATPIFNIGNKEPLFQETDKLIESVETEITERMLVTMAGPLELATMYQAHVSILDIETKQYVEEFGKPKPQSKNGDEKEVEMVRPTLDDYRVKVKEFFDIANAIEVASHNFEDFSIVRVDCCKIKLLVSSKAREIGNGLLDAIVSDVKARNEKIVATYESILEKISQTPINEKELQELKEFIARCTHIINEQESEVEKLHTSLNLVQQFGHTISYEDFELAWSTKQWPKRVQNAAENCESVLENDKIRMMDKLALEKETFEADLEVSIYLAQRTPAHPE